MDISGMTSDDINYKLRSGDAKDADAYNWIELANSKLVSIQYRPVRFVDGGDSSQFGNYSEWRNRNCLQVISFPVIDDE